MDHDDKTIATIEMCRRVLRGGFEQFARRGIKSVDIAIGAMFAASDLATAMHQGDPHAAIEWQRTALDVMERQLLEISSIGRTQ